MTKVNGTEKKMDAIDSKRQLRRRLLKTGALAAPVAMTLHGGVPLAHAASAGLCEFELIEIANKGAYSADPRTRHLQIPMHGNQLAKLEKPPTGGELDIDDYEEGSQLIPFDGSQEHWKFLSNPSNGGYAMSCYNSIVAFKNNCNNGIGNLDQCAPGNSLFHNAAENDTFPKGNQPPKFPEPNPN